VTLPTLARIAEIADSIFPFSLAEAWDNCGIQIGEPHRMVTSVAFSLDPTPMTVRFARENSCQLLVTHHPVILEPLLRILPDSLPGRTLLKAASAGIDILSLHTNLDAAPGGLNDRLAAVLGLQEVVTPLPARCARMGLLRTPVSVTALARRLANDLSLSGVRIIAEAERVVRTVFCASGSGMGYLADAIRLGADVIVTGDVKYHSAREAAEMGVAVIDAGHFGLEKIAVQLMTDSFRTEFEQRGLEVSCFACDLEKDPFDEILNRRGGLHIEGATRTSRATSRNR
jgi:GTP cyclohydrolase I